MVRGSHGDNARLKECAAIGPSLLAKDGLA